MNSGAVSASVFFTFGKDIQIRGTCYGQNVCCAQIIKFNKEWHFFPFDITVSEFSHFFPFDITVSEFSYS